MTAESPMQARRVYETAEVATTEHTHEAETVMVRDDGVYVNTHGEQSFTYPAKAVSEIVVEMAGTPSGTDANLYRRFPDGAVSPSVYREHVTVLDDGWVRTERQPADGEDLITIVDVPPNTVYRIEWNP